MSGRKDRSRELAEAKILILEESILDLKKDNAELQSNANWLEDKLAKADDLIESKNDASHDWHDWRGAVTDLMAHIAYHKPVLPEVLQKKLTQIDLLHSVASKA